MNMECEQLNYCKTKWQKIVVDAYVKSGCDIKKTAKALNRTTNCIYKIIHKLDKKTNLQKENNLNINSTSTLYDKDGNVIQKWVKTNVEKTNDVLIYYKEFCKEYSKKLPRYKSEKYTLRNVEKKLVVYPIADLHLGMLAWEKETGNNYNTKIATKMVLNIVKKIIDRSPSCEECLICNLGDFLHVDNQVKQTERSGNVLDVDGRYAKILNVGIKLMRYMIEYCLQKHKKVTVVNCIGNHDDLGSLWLSSALSNIYENEKRIKIVNSPTQRHYYKYGNTLIGLTHGSDVKQKDLPIVMATEKKEDWGRTKYHYFYTGHVHKDTVMEIGDCKIESFRALCSKDAWSISKGYLSGRDIKIIFIDSKNGETERLTFNI